MVESLTENQIYAIYLWPNFFDKIERERNSSHYVGVEVGDSDCGFLLSFFAATFLSDTGRPDDVCQRLNSMEKRADDEEGGDGEDEGEEGHVDEVHRLVAAAKLPVH